MSPEITIEPKTGKRINISIFSPQEARFKTEKDQGAHRQLFIAGPTACGKTEVSLLVAEAVKGEIVSADSMQIYRGMDVGTAKATLQQQAVVPHHMLDTREVWQPFNVVDFYHEASTACEEIVRKGKVPIVVGGAGFYLHALLYGPPAGPPSVEELRAEIEADMNRIGPEAMYEQLKAADPDYAATLTPHDRQKIIRGLEIIRLTGFSVSSLSWKDRPPSVQGSFRCWFLHRPREVLYQRIEERCEQMLADGFLDEVAKLEVAGISQNRSACHAIGYRQALHYLKSERSNEDYDQFVKEFKQASRRYVKRQFTWFRQEPLFKWIDVEGRTSEEVAEEITQQFYLM